ncbi:MAG: hypothetical protein J6S54_04795 [Lentisphaeria bacterium]|nr:hypothetical protein [Lentisphaeria bacterium]
MQTADDPFLRQLKGMIDAFSGNDGEADFSDYFNSIYRRWGENVRRELLAAFFDAFISAGVVPGNWSWEGENERFLLSECRSFIKNLLQIREMLPQYGVLPGARRLFVDLEELTDAELLADAIAGADRFLVGRVFRFIGRRFEAVEPDSAKDVGKFFGFPGVRSSFQDHFHKYSSGMSNVPLLIHSLPGYGKTSMTISYALAEKDIVLILPEPEALEEGWHALMEPLTARRDLKFVVFFDDIDPRSVNWYKFRTHVGGAFTLPDNVNVVLSANYEFPASILSRGRRVNFPVFDEIRCMEMVEDFLHDFGLRAIPGNLVPLIAADYTEEFGQHKFTELSPRTLMRYLGIYQKNPVKRRNIVELAMGPMITRPDPELFYEFNIELMRTLYGEEYIKRLLKERLNNL